MRYLLDTNVVSEVSKKRPSGKVLNFIQANETQCVVPAIVVAERYHGANTAPPDQRAAMLKAGMISAMSLPIESCLLMRKRPKYGATT
jgi:predicted nucleic acid-binding protein